MSKLLSQLQLSPTRNKCESGHVVIITIPETHFIILGTNGCLAVAVGDNATSLTPLSVLDLAFVEETAHVSPEIVVTVIDTLARIEVNINEGDASNNLIGSAIVSDLEPLGGVNLGTVRASDGGHLLDAALNQDKKRKGVVR